MPGIRPFEARALLVPEDQAGAHAYSDRLRAEGRLPGANSTAATVAYVLAFVFIAGMGVIVGSAVAVASSFLKEGAVIIGILSSLPVLLGFGALVAAFFAGRRRIRQQEVRRWRLGGFARDVGMEFVPAIPEPPLPGVIFSIGSGRTATDVVRGYQPRFVEIGNYAYVVSNGKNSTTVTWGYIAIRLGTPLPHIVLDATANDGAFGSNLPASWVRGQRLSLEGDFDRHFRLFCPQGYERDALYLFTPDVMARFIDNAAVLDAEIVDDWLFLYSREELSGVDPARWAWVFSVVSALLDKLEQWERWRDDRLTRESAPMLPAQPAAPAVATPSGAVTPGAHPAPGTSSPPVVPPALLEPGPRGVSAPGRRLRRSNPWVIVLAIVGGTFVLGLLLMIVPLVFLLSI